MWLQNLERGRPVIYNSYPLKYFLKISFLIFMLKEFNVACWENLYRKTLQQLVLQSLIKLRKVLNKKWNSFMENSLNTRFSHSLEIFLWKWTKCDILRLKQLSFHMAVLCPVRVPIQWNVKIPGFLSFINCYWLFYLVNTTVSNFYKCLFKAMFSLVV